MEAVNDIKEPLKFVSGKTVALKVGRYKNGGIALRACAVNPLWDSEVDGDELTHEQESAIGTRVFILYSGKSYSIVDKMIKANMLEWAGMNMLMDGYKKYREATLNPSVCRAVCNMDNDSVISLLGF